MSDTGHIQTFLLENALPQRNGVVKSDEVDPAHYIKTAFDSPVPGYTVEWDEGHNTWDIMDAKDHYVGYIYYDPQLDIPDNADPSWKDLHWLAVPLRPRGYDRMFPAFDDAALHIINGPPGKKIAETLLETDLSAPEPDYVDPQYYADTLGISLSSLKERLSQFYTTVNIHVRKPTFKMFQSERQWMVACRRSTPMPMPARYGGESTSPGNVLKLLIDKYLTQWADDNSLCLRGLEIHGYLRKNVTFRFLTRRKDDQRVAPESGYQLNQESTDDVNVAAFMADF